MSKELQNIKNLIDAAIAKGLFVNAETVQAVMDSYWYVAYAVEVYERVRDDHEKKLVNKNNSEGSMPDKSKTVNHG